jgi:chitinase
MVTYDTKPVALQKCSFIREWQLGGAMWWESSGDKAGDESLITTVHGALSDGVEYRENVLVYPGSKYENLKKGFPGEGEGGC